MPEGQARPIVAGGVLAGVSVMLALASAFIPFVNLVWPLPLCLLVVRHGMRHGLMAVAVSAVGMMLLLSPTQALFLVGSGGLVGLVLGLCIRRGYTAASTLLIGAAAGFVSNLLLIVMVMQILGMNVFELNADIQNQATQLMQEVSRQMGGGAAEEAEIAAIGAEMARAYVMLFPAGLFLYAVGYAVINFQMARFVLRRMGNEVAGLLPMSEWRLPGAVLYVFILALVASYWGGKWQSQWLMIVAENVRLIAACGMFVQGLGLLLFVLERSDLLRRVRWLITALVIISPMLNLMLVVLGGVDMLLDYRGKLRRRNG